MALMIWPVLAIAGEASVLNPAVKARVPRELSFGLVTAQSVTTSLVLFNAMFALQTGLDLTYLWSGAALPAGMTHAEYAHRGAYPLVATALLAGGFALMSRPFAAESRLVRGLLLAWVGQNVALVISSLYRLDMYVAEYGLTYLRVHAGIWMVLVAVWLAFVGLLMISRVPTPSLKGLTVPRSAAVPMLLGVTVYLWALATRPWLVLVLSGLLYLAVLAVFAARSARKKAA